MLCFGKEDELKIYRKFHLHNYEELKDDRSDGYNKERIDGNGNGKKEEANKNELKNKNNTIEVDNANTEENSENLKSIENHEYARNNKDYGEQKGNVQDTITVTNEKHSYNGKNLQDNIIEQIFDDSVIYLNTSMCNNFIYIITKYCFYIFDNSDFSYITFLVLNSKQIEKYGFYKKVYLSSMDNTVYIISDNLRYVYAYYIVNKEDVLVLDSQKNTFRLNIGETFEDNSSEDENEFYEYITYIKNTYKKKKKKCKHVSIKLITMLFLPIVSNCLMMTKNNILFFSHQTDEVFISDSIQQILTNSSNLQKNKNHKVVIDTIIVSLNNVLIKKNNREKKEDLNNKRKENNYIKKKTRKKKKFHILGYFKKQKEKKDAENVATIKSKKVNKNKKIINNSTSECLQKKKNKKKNKQSDFTTHYLYSEYKDSNLYEFIIKNKNRRWKKKTNNNILIKGIYKVEFYSYNDYLILLSSTGDMYIFSFFHNFFNFSKKKCCYYSGRNVHKEKEKEIMKTNQLKRKQMLKKKTSKIIKNKKPVMGVFVGSDIIDVSMNIHKKIMLLTKTNFVIKGYNMHPYICKHSFRTNLFTIDINTYYNILYYNFIIWNKQCNFFLVSINENDYFIFNSNGTLYYPTKNCITGKEQSAENEKELIKYQSNFTLHPFEDTTQYLAEYITSRVNQKKKETSIEIKTTNEEGEINNLCKENTFTEVQQKRKVMKNNSSINIGFVFNDFKLFSIKEKDEYFFYIKSKNIYYSNDIYSNSKTFHYNSNYYTNGTFRKIYIGFNNLIIINKDIDTYNVNDYEQNWADITEIKPPFKFIKKAYLNFDNTFILIIFKDICIYNIYKKTFSYFIDNYLQQAFHNYPSGWISNDIFFVTCLHNRHDELNFKTFKKESTGISVFPNLRFFRKENNIQGKEKMKDSHSNDGNYISQSQDMRTPMEVNNPMEMNEYDLERHKKMNYLFNLNHSENEKYFKFLEEYFNINKCNIYTKPFTSFYNKLFLNKEENVFLENFRKHHEKQIPNCAKKESDIKEIKISNEPNEKIKEENKGIEENPLRHDNSLKSFYKNVYLKNNKSSRKSEYISKNEKRHTNKVGSFFFVSDSNSSVSNDDYESNNKHEKTLHSYNNSISLSETQNPDYIKNASVETLNNGTNKNDIYKIKSNYDEIIERNNFYYVIYLYDIKRILKFTNYVCSIKLLYRPILTHVHYKKQKENDVFGYKSNDINNTTDTDVKYKNQKENSKDKEMEECDSSFLTILDAFDNLLCFKINKGETDDIESNESLIAANVFMLPLNKDNKFKKTISFYALFDIYNYVFLHFDNTITFLHIYRNNNSGQWDFQRTQKISYHFDYMEIISNKKNVFYYALPTPIYHMWPISFYNIYLVYYYLFYILYKMNLKKTNDKTYSTFRKQKNAESRMHNNKENEEKEINVNKSESILNQRKSTKYDNNMLLEKNKNFMDTLLSNFFQQEEFQRFEVMFNNELNKHSKNYKNFLRIKKEDQRECSCLVKAEEETSLVFKNLEELLHKNLVNTEENNNDEPESKFVMTEEKNIISFIQKMKNSVKKKKDTMDIFEKIMIRLMKRISKKEKCFMKKINKILKYTLYHVIEEIENSEDTCCIYLSYKNRIDVVSISKCSDKFILFEGLKNKKILKNYKKYQYCNLFIYRYLKLKKIMNQGISSIHHTIHNNGIFLSVFLKQQGVNNANSLNGKEIYNKNNKNFYCDKILFQIHTYIDAIWLRYLKLYSAIFSVFSLKKGLHCYKLPTSCVTRKKVKSFIVHIMKTYIDNNTLAINILDIILYQSMHELNNFYMLLYKFVFQFVNHLCNTKDEKGEHHFMKIKGRNKNRTILNITITILYIFFLGKKFKKKKWGMLKKKVLEEIITFKEEETTETNFYFDVDTYAHLENGNKICALKKGIETKHVYSSILYLLKIRENFIIDSNGKEETFDIKSEYVYKMNSNVYYVVLYLLCVLKKKQVYHLYTLLHILRKYAKNHFAEVVVSIIRKMEPYVSAILIYAIGYFMPHYFMKKSLENYKFHVSSLYIVNVQNYIGICDVRKFYCINLLLFTLRYNITFSKKLIYYLSIVFYHIFEIEKKNIFYWNFLNLPIPNEKFKIKTKKNCTNFLHLLLSVYNLNKLTTKRIRCIQNLEFCFDNSTKKKFRVQTSDTVTRKKEKRADKEQILKNNLELGKQNGNSNNENEKEKEKEKGITTATTTTTTTIQIEDDYFRNDNESKKIKNQICPNIKIKSFTFKQFQMNKIIYEFFYSEDIINAIYNNIKDFQFLHNCDNNVFFHSWKNQALLKEKTKERDNEKGEDKVKMNVDGDNQIKINRDDSFNFDNILEIYIHFIALIQNTVCFYIFNMLWFELFYFITHFKIDILSFFSYSYFFQSDLFQNISWGICPIDVAQYSRSKSEKYFFHLKLSEKNSNFLYPNCNAGNESVYNTNDVCCNYQQYDSNIFNTSGNENFPPKKQIKGKKNYKKKKNTFVWNSNYENYVSNMKYLNYIYYQVEKKRKSLDNIFNDDKKTISFLDIYQSFKRHFDMKYGKEKKTKKTTKNIFQEDDNTYLKKTEVKHKKQKYQQNILFYNIYNKQTDYIFLETYFPPSTYACIPIYNTLKYLFYFFKVCNKNSIFPKNELNKQIKKRIYDYISNNIIDVNKKKENLGDYKKGSIEAICDFHKNDIIWFLLKIFILLKLPIHAMALVLYCKNYVLLNVLFNIFPYLIHVTNYIMNMNTLHFLYKRGVYKKEHVRSAEASEQEKRNKKQTFILTDEQFNKNFCEYCYKSILNYGVQDILPFSNEILEKAYKKQYSNEATKHNDLYDHFVYCHCLNNLFFLKKKLLRTRKIV